MLNLRSLVDFELLLLLLELLMKNVFSVVNGCFFSSFSRSLKRSLLEEARTVFRKLVLLSGEVSRKSSFLFSVERLFSSLMLEMFSRLFLAGEGDVDLFRSNSFKGEECLESAAAARSLADVTFSSELSFADFEGECSLMQVGFPGPIEM